MSIDCVGCNRQQLIFAVAVFLSLSDVCSSEWKPAVDLAAVDCAAEVNSKICTGFGITGYPTIKVLYSKKCLHRATYCQLL